MWNLVKHNLGVKESQSVTQWNFFQREEFCIFRREKFSDLGWGRFNISIMQIFVSHVANFGLSQSFRSERGGIYEFEITKKSQVVLPIDLET